MGKINQSGMTLIELLLVVGVIFVLTGIIVVNRNPVTSTAQQRNRQREVDITEIAQVIHQYKIHNNNQYPKTEKEESIPDCAKGMIKASELSSRLVGSYLNQIPIDPKTDQQYLVCQENDKIKVTSPGAELGQTIEIIR